MSEGLLSFWVTVDSTGSSEKIELINEDCNINIYDDIVESFQKVKWKPALFNNGPVIFRFRETIFIRNYNADAPAIQKS